MSYCILICKRSGSLCHVLTQDHIVLPARLPPTRLSKLLNSFAFIHKWRMNHTCLYFPAARRHRTLAGTYFPSRMG